MRTGSRWLTALVAMGALAGCGPVDPGGEGEEAPAPGGTRGVQVAFAGGGWRASTAHAAWTMSLLDEGAHTLDEIFTHVDTLSSNSGGTWYLTMLAYSQAFRASIEAPGALAAYPVSGYLGQQENLLDKIDGVDGSSVCSWLPEDDTYLRFYCRISTLTGDDLPVWKDIVRDVVFEPFGMAADLAGKALSSSRQSWATGKSLLLAATILTEQAVLNENDWLDERYYDANLTTSGPKQATVTPVTLASVAKDRTAPAFLTAGGLDLHYKENADFPPPPKSTQVDNPLATDQVKILIAAAASSAAAGAAASHTVVAENGYDLPWQVAYELSDLAIPFSLTPPIDYRSAAGLSVDDLAQWRLVRLADGGYADNSAVAHVVNFLQTNGQDDGFHIVAFDNVQKAYQPAKGAAVGIDIAYLFGAGLGPQDNKFCVGSSGDQICVTIPSPKIFLADALDTTATWTYTPDPETHPENQLIYTQYPVTTVKNRSLGVTQGSTGVLHVFTCAWAGAETAPFDGKADFTAYAAMLDAINTGLKADEGVGLNYLRAALKL